MELPDETVLDIFKFLTCKDLVTMCRVSHRSNELCNDDSVWHEQCLSQFGWLEEFGVSVAQFKTSQAAQCTDWKKTYRRFAKKYLSQVPWFSQQLNRQETERNLAGKMPGSYIVRNSSELPHYVVSYISETGGIEHALVHNLGPYRGVFFAGKTSLYASLSSLIRAHNLVLRKPAFRAEVVERKSELKRVSILNYLSDQRARGGKSVEQLGLLHHACKYGLVDVVEMILQYHKEGKLQVTLTSPFGSKSRTPMHFLAARSGIIPSGDVLTIANLLIDSELPIDLDTFDALGNTALHLAIDHYKPCDKFIEELIERLGADFLIPRRLDGAVPLHLAVQRNNIKLLNILVNKRDEGVDLNVKQASAQRRTPLHLSCNSGLLSCTRRLLELGADPSAQDICGSTPLHLCVSDPQDWTNLARVGKPMAQPNYSHQLMRVLLDSKQKVVNKTDVDGRTALHVACLNGHRTSAFLLLEHGCDPTLRDSYGKTAADYCRQGPTSWQVEQHVFLLEEKIAAGYNPGPFTSQSIRNHAVKHFNEILAKLESAQSY